MGFALTGAASPQKTENIPLSAFEQGEVEPTVWYWEDEAKTLSLQAVQQKFEQGEFQKTDSNFNLGYSRSRYWVHFAISVESVPPSTNRKALLMVFDYPHLDQINIFRAEGNQPPKHWVTLGDKMPFVNRVLQTSTYVVPESILLGKTYRYWVQIDTTSSIQLHPSIWDKDRYIEEGDRQTVLYGAFYGVLLVMAMYNAFIGFSIKDRAYLYYVGYILSFLLLQGSIVGHGFEYLWPSQPWINAFAIPTFIMLSIAFAASFSREFLQLEQHSAKLNLSLLALSAVSIIVIASFFFLEYPTRIAIAIWFALINTVLILLAAVVSWLSGFRYARLFLLAWVTLLIAAVIVAFTPLGYFPSNWLTRHAGQVGSAIEVVLLSLALADRINRMKAEAQSIELRSKRLLEEKNQELNSALKLITKNNSLKDEFLATISHELRTPMNGVEGSLQVIKDEILDDRVRAHVDAATNSANHMTQLVDSLLEYSELLSGNWKLQELPFSLSEVLSKLTSTIESECARKGVDFEISTDPQLKHRLIGDALRINHVLFQLLENAIKFTHEGAIKFVITSQEEGEYYRINFLVSDTGIGISEQQLGDIFDGFKQVDGSFSRQYGGLGLGLSLCKSIADKMGGKISIRSQLGEGTAVEMDILLKKEESVKRQDTLKPTIIGKPLILIVEDNPVNQMTLTAIVKKIGCEVEKANNGEEAVIMSKNKKYDCILMDCQMPILDGFEATKKIRSEDNINKDTYIIAVTANAMSGDRDRCLNAGMDDYIRKPVKKDVIFKRLSYWLSISVA